MKLFQKSLLFTLALLSAITVLGQETTPVKDTLTEPKTPKQQEEIHHVPPEIDEFPIFSGCEDLESYEERKKCSDVKMAQFIYGNLKHPEIAEKHGVEGTVVVVCIIDEEGKLRESRLLKDIGAGCGAEAMRVVEMMPDWSPAKLKGKPVEVRLNLPIKFKLDGTIKPKSKEKKKRKRKWKFW